MSEPIALPKRVSFQEVLQNRNFSLLWIGQIISLLGDRAHQIALPILVYQMTGSPLKVGMLYAVMGLAWVLLGPIAGALVDRGDRKWTMIIADLLRAGLVFLIPWAATINISLIYLLAFLVTTFSVFFNPARLSVVPDIVRPRELLTANSLYSISETMVDLVGYPLAGLLVTVAGAFLAFYLDALSFLFSAGLIFLTLIPPSLARPGSVGEPCLGN